MKIEELVKMPEPDTRTDYHHDGCGRRAFTQAAMLRYGEAVAAAVAKRCADLCESMVDAKEQERAEAAAMRAIVSGTMRDKIDRLSHESTVHLYNRAMQKCADAIRREFGEVSK